MAGGLLELVAHGVQDIYLIGNPQITFFKVVYKRHTNFSMESIQATFDGNIDFGQKVSALLPRNGDLAHTIILEVDLPQIESDDTTATGTYDISYVNSLGHALIRYVEIEIGGNLIDRQYGQWMEIWTQLSSDEAKQNGYREMLSRYTGSEISNYRNVSGPITVYIPLQFWFCRNIGLALPLVALQYHDVRINIQFEELNKLWTYGENNYYTASMSSGTVTKTSGNDFVATDLIRKNIYWADGTTTSTSGGTISSGTTITGLSGDKSIQEMYIGSSNGLLQDVSIIDARLFIDYIFLDTYERKKFAQMKHRYLIEQVQYNGKDSFNADQVSKKFPLSFNLPVKSIYWVSQLDRVNRANEWFNFSHTVDKSSTKDDPLTKAVLQLNGTERFTERNAKYFRLIQPFQKHSRVPITSDGGYIYMYSFCLQPEKHQPSGSCNFSKIDSADLNLTFTSGLKTGTITVYALSYNVLRIFSGMGGLAFTN